jgi:hypothetical protein
MSLYFYYLPKGVIFLQDFNEKKLVWMAWAIMIGIIGPIISFVGPTLFQEIFRKDRNTLYIDIPMTANILFLSGVVLLVLFCVLMYLGRKFIAISVASVLVSGTLFFLSCNYYLMITKENLIESPLFSLEDITYDWDDIAKGKMLYTDPKAGIGNLILTFKDGHIMEFERNKYMLENIGMINKLLKENGIVIKNEINEEVWK